jgi:hypothetical protein
MRSRARLWASLLLGTALAAPAGAGELWQWTDEQGVVRYTPHRDRVPAGQRDTLVKVEPGAPEPAQAPAASASQAPVIYAPPDEIDFEADPFNAPERARDVRVEPIPSPPTAPQPTPPSSPEAQPLAPPSPNARPQPAPAPEAARMQPAPAPEAARMQPASASGRSSAPPPLAPVDAPPAPAGARTPSREPAPQDPAAVTRRAPDPEPYPRQAPDPYAPPPPEPRAAASGTSEPQLAARAAPAPAPEAAGAGASGARAQDPYAGYAGVVAGQSSGAPPPADVAARRAELEREIAAQEAALEDLISRPADGTRLEDTPEFREIARRLPELQAELRELDEAPASEAQPREVP